MASSFINKGELGFWAKDGFVEAMQLLLITEIENLELVSQDNWLEEYKIELAFQSMPLILGGMSMGLDEFITSVDRSDKLINIIDLLINRMSTEPNYLSSANLNQHRYRAMEILKETQKVNFKDNKDFMDLVNSSQWKGPIPSEIKNRYEHSFILLRKLLKGELSTDAGSQIDYWNY